MPIPWREITNGQSIDIECALPSRRKQQPLALRVKEKKIGDGVITYTVNGRRDDRPDILAWLLQIAPAKIAILGLASDTRSQ